MSDSQNGTGNYWGWLDVAQKQAKDFANKAQEFAEVASKATQEQATYLAKQASELRQNYDMEVATSILMSTVGGPVDTSYNNQQTRKPAKMNFRDLDLVYITENLVAMAFPYENKSSNNAENGNDIDVVAAYLRKKHKDHFMIWNISEESYDYSKFDNQVLEYKFPGHPAPPLGLLFKICTSVESWLDADESNIAVIHCLTGKGRTAALTACIMAWIGEFLSPMEALQYIADRRGISVDNLTIPSQRRYVQYFTNMLDGVKPRSEPLLLRRIIINSIPVFGTNGVSDNSTVNRGCCPYLQLFKNGKLIATATPQSDSNQDNSSGSSGNDGANKMQLRWINASEGSASFSIDCAIQGDILLRCRHAATSGVRVSMFRAGFHTGYVPSGVLRLTKAQLDGSSSDPRYAEDFFIDLIFAPIVKATTAATAGHEGQTATYAENSSTDSGSGNQVVLGTSVAGTSAVTDSGLTIDATSTDKYELGLYKDTRFWETVATRKTRNKRRRSRKFVSRQQDQFSIGDDSKLPSGSSNEREEEEVSFGAHAAVSTGAAAGASSMSGLSDMELIMQLAQLEGGSDVSVVGSEGSGSDQVSSGSVFEQGDSDDYTLVGHKKTPISSSTTTPPRAPMTANAELLALAELERELGLGDMQLFGSSASASATSASKTALQTPVRTSSAAAPASTASSAFDDEDNLDDLEKYLQSLSSTPSAAAAAPPAAI